MARMRRTSEYPQQRIHELRALTVGLDDMADPISVLDVMPPEQANADFPALDGHLGEDFGPALPVRN
jgi:hypothetical protein